MAEPVREAVLAAARGWLGTPYRHQGSCRGAGADCLGLLRGVWREVMGAEPAPVPAYTADWAEREDGERLLKAARAHLMEITPEVACPGDVVVFRLKDAGAAKHVAILTARGEDGLEGGRIIHAYSGHAVCETALSAPWARRLAGVFAFPGAFLGGFAGAYPGEGEVG
ncbi:MAG: NlpC/P60 family protein [Pseudomonadota bacterium]